ncbi:carbon-nitrogen family hydrolase [Halococcus thailandensis]|uniref:Nitrilase n=1 Tax=Halococcus thailandensis JCM 13552 TaxID=1227457 RepID=M0MW20_9EURY|nr:carbon-nitrogen family hydrolase [Halococcus thailandensis]EMA49493.1 nitrilase [Halococcus thailandensis JCM 13552]
MRLACCQHDIEPGAIEANVERALAAIATAADDGADLVCLPEIFSVGYFAFDEYERAAESLAGPTLARIADAARTHDVGVLAGSIVEELAASARDGFETPSESGLANTSVFFDRNGERRAVYRKHHLFGYESREAELLVPGDSLGLAAFDGFTIGTTTCYDLRFPELYREFVAAGATLILVPSAWPYPRVDHWQLLPRARAIENQLFVAACNGSGVFGETALCGRSAIYDPWGEISAQAGAGEHAADEPTIVTADIDPERVTSVREEFPALRDRR